MKRVFLLPLILGLQNAYVISEEQSLPRISPPYQHVFKLPLLIPEVKRPLATYTNPETGVPIDFYQLQVQEDKQQFYTDLSAATIKGYDGSFPGPTFRVEKGREAVIRIVNNASTSANFHVHGSYARARKS